MAIKDESKTKIKNKKFWKFKKGLPLVVRRLECTSGGDHGAGRGMLKGPVGAGRAQARVGDHGWLADVQARGHQGAGKGAAVGFRNSLGF
ncbi:hypothetical protein GQ457_04G027710 [Hibiscus cannabinus]